MENLKINLAACRVNANLSQNDAAEKLGITRQTLRNWEQGRVIPNYKKLIKLSELYNIPIDNIFLSITDA